MQTGLAAYRQNAVDHSSQGQLIVMLYDGVLSALDKVEVALGSEPCDIETSHRELLRCQAIVEELLSTLSPAGGDVASQLASLYEYCHHQLVDANLSKRFDHAEPVRAVFADLRVAWAALAGLDHG